MTAIYILLGVALLLFLYIRYFERDPDALDRSGRPKYRKRRKK